jgi:hypothetical protein
MAFTDTTHIPMDPHLNHPLSLSTNKRRPPVLATLAEKSRQNYGWGGGGHLKLPAFAVAIIYKQKAVYIGNWQVTVRKEKEDGEEVDEKRRLITEARKEREKTVAEKDKRIE